MLKGKSLLEPMDFTEEEFEEIFDLAEEIIEKREKYAHCADGKLMGALFYEPSTRTRFSFEAAMLRLGGQVIGFSEAASSSASKGESISDTVRVIANYVDLLVMRHPKEGAPMVADMATDVPVINAGDGGHQHPTQTLTDLLTIRRIKRRLTGLTIGICGDLKFGRTVHSLIRALSRYKGVKFVLISPEELTIPDYVRQGTLLKNDIPFEEVRTMDEALPKLDILYMTRVQKERFFNEDDYIRLKDTYILDAKKMLLAGENMMVLHPLPRVNEISIEIDSDPRAYYFEQAKYGMYVRMALIIKLLGLEVQS
jgi:aspartate carbamoyltransferase catalytic subunit